MNRTLLSAALLLTFAAPAAFAQAAPAAPVERQQRVHNPHKAAMKMSKQLGLSQDQTAKLEPILAERRAKMQALKADTSLSPDQKKEQRKAIGKDTRLQMSNVLTPEQMSNLKAIRREHKRHAAQS